jgi:hypothetical protein
MPINTLETFFLWCTILNGAIMLFSFIFYLCAKDWICRIHCRIFGASRDTFYSLAELFIVLYKTDVHNIQSGYLWDPDRYETSPLGNMTLQAYHIIGLQR